MNPICWTMLMILGACFINGEELPIFPPDRSVVTIAQISDEVEQWKSGKPSAKLIDLCRNYTAVDDQSLGRIFNLIGLAMRIDPIIDSDVEPEFWINKRTICIFFSSSPFTSNAIFKRNFPENRSHCARIISTFLSQVAIRKRIHPNLPAPTRNAMPPGGGIAGQSPDDIPDLEARKQYIKAIALNNSAKSEMLVQNFIHDISESLPDKIIDNFISLFANEPHNYDEMKEYMSLFDLNAGIRKQILNEIALQTGMKLEWP